MAQRTTITRSNERDSLAPLKGRGAIYVQLTFCVQMSWGNVLCSSERTVVEKEGLFRVRRAYSSIYVWCNNALLAQLNMT